MDVIGNFAGKSPVILPFQIGEAMAAAGVPVVVGGAGIGGVSLAATTTASDFIGITTNIQATLVTAQQAGNADPERLVRVIVNPDMIIKARLSGSSTSGADLTVYTVTTASTTGLDVVTGDDFTNFDEGAIHCIKGANVGVTRKIGVGDATDATVVIAFPNDIAVGDQFIVLPFFPGENQFVQLTTDLTEVDASAAVDTDNNNFRVLNFQLDGVSNSHVLLVPFDSLYAAGGSI